MKKPVRQTFTVRQAAQFLYSSTSNKYIHRIQRAIEHGELPAYQDEALGLRAPFYITKADLETYAKKAS